VNHSVRGPPLGIRGFCVPIFIGNVQIFGLNWFSIRHSGWQTRAQLAGLQIVHVCPACEPRAIRQHCVLVPKQAPNKWSKRRWGQKRWGKKRAQSLRPKRDKGMEDSGNSGGLGDWGQDRTDQDNGSLTKEREQQTSSPRRRHTGGKMPSINGSWIPKKTKRMADKLNSSHYLL